MSWYQIFQDVFNLRTMVDCYIVKNLLLLYSLPQSLGRSIKKHIAWAYLEHHIPWKNWFCSLFVQVKAFGTQKEVDAWLLSNPRRSAGALHFIVRNKTVISYGIQTNFTLITKREDRTFKFQIPLQLAAEREIARSLIGGHKHCFYLLLYIWFYLIGPLAFVIFFYHSTFWISDPNFSWVVGLKEFAHPKIEFSSSLDAMVPPFFVAATMFGFVFQMGSLVTEKELKLRQVFMTT